MTQATSREPSAGSPRAVVLLPTYNERETLPRIVPAILAAAPVDIMVLDDNSPDGTGDIADSIAKAEPRVRVVHRPGKLGLGRAYLDGFRRALDAGYERILEMDADFSHPPSALPALLELSESYDLVLGSRWVEGGGIENWPWYRQLISRGGSLYARMWLSSGVRDLTGGFKCFRREVLEAIDLTAVRTTGYAFQIEVTYRALQRGFRVVETPITFSEREQGNSKMSRRIVIEAVLRVPLMRLGDPSMKPLLRLLHYVRPEVPTVIVAYLCMIVLAVTHTLYAFLIGPAFKFIFSGDVSDVLRTSTGEIRSLWRAVPTDWIAAVEGLDRTQALMVLPVLIGVIALVKGLAQTGQFSLLGRTAQRILRAVRGDTFDAMMRQSPAFFSRRAHGDLLSRLTNDANIAEQAVFYGLAPLLREPLQVVALLIFCFVTTPKLALFFFVIVPLAVLPIVRFAKRLKKVSRRGQEHQGIINAAAYEALAGIRVVQAFGTEATEHQKLDAAAGHYYRQMIKSYFIRAVRTPTMEVLGALALAGLLALLGYQVTQNNADPAKYISFLGAVFLMYDPLKKLGNVSDYLANGSAAAERIFEIHDAVPDIRDAEDARELPPFEKRLAFEGVHFAYDSTPVLNGVDLEIPAGNLVALVGSTGSGKTTMAHLLPRFWDVTDGRLTVDGQDVRQFTLASLRRQISVVSQETFLFNASIAENIAYGRADASEEQIRDAARAAYADEFIERLEHGYDTVVGERGVRLSGGQRQRLAIARALLRDAPILILDEATSALDVESERFVQQALEVLMRGRTSLVIAHRLSTVRRADTIAVLKDGIIVERGDHDALLAQDGEYARLYALQFQDDPAPAPVVETPVS